MKNARALHLFVAAVYLLTLLSGCQKPGTLPAQEIMNQTETGSNSAGTCVAVYPIDLRYTDYAVLKYPASTEETAPPKQEINPPSGSLVPGGDTPPFEGTIPLTPEPAGTEEEQPQPTAPDTPSDAVPTEPTAPEDGSTQATEQDSPTESDQPAASEPTQVVVPQDPSDDPAKEIPGEMLSSDTDSIADGIVTGIPLDNTSTTAFRYYEKADPQTGLEVYRIQLQQKLKGAVTVFTGTMTGSEVKWDSKDAPMDPALTDALLANTQWLPCSRDGIYAIHQSLTKCTVLALTVIYTNSDNTLFQAQHYSETGELLYIADLSEDSSTYLPGGTQTAVNWSEDLYPQLSLDFSTHTDTPKIPKCLLIVTAILAVSTVLLLVFNLTCLIRNLRRRAQRAARKSRNTPPDFTPGSITEVKSVGTVHNIGSRQGQQDSFDVVNCSAGTLAVVADGMGGLSDGDKVSQKIVATMRADALRIRPGQTDTVLCQMAAHANQEVNRMLGAARQYKCGSTLLAVLVEKYTVRWITVGDSRIYLYRGGSLIQLNREHIYRAELLERAINGKLSFSEALHDPQSERLSSFIGMGELKHVDFCQNSLQLLPGDRILLMSDGIFNTLSNQDISRAISSTPNAASAAAQLEQRVLQAASPNQDNFTCVILEL